MTTVKQKITVNKTFKTLTKVIYESDSYYELMLNCTMCDISMNHAVHSVICHFAFMTIAALAKSGLSNLFVDQHFCLTYDIILKNVITCQNIVVEMLKDNTITFDNEFLELVLKKVIFTKQADMINALTTDQIKQILVLTVKRNSDFSKKCIQKFRQLNEIQIFQKNVFRNLDKN